MAGLSVLQDLLGLPAFQLPQLFRLPTNLLGLLEEIDELPYLGPQDDRTTGLIR